MKKKKPPGVTSLSAVSSRFCMGGQGVVSMTPMYTALFLRKEGRLGYAFCWMARRAFAELELLDTCGERFFGRKRKKKKKRRRTRKVLGPFHQSSGYRKEVPWDNVMPPQQRADPDSQSPPSPSNQSHPHPPNVGRWRCRSPRTLPRQSIFSSPSPTPLLAPTAPPSSSPRPRIEDTSLRF